MCTYSRYPSRLNCALLSYRHLSSICCMQLQQTRSVPTLEYQKVSNNSKGLLTKWSTSYKIAVNKLRSFHHQSFYYMIFAAKWSKHISVPNLIKKTDGQPSLIHACDASTLRLMYYINLHMYTIIYIINVNRNH